MPLQCGDALCCSAPIWDYRKDSHEKIVSISTIGDIVIRGIKFNPEIIFYIEDKFGNPIRLALGCEHLTPCWDTHLYFRCSNYDSRPNYCREHPPRGKLCFWDLVLAEEFSLYVCLSDKARRSLLEEKLSKTSSLMKKILQNFTIENEESKNYRCFLLSDFPEYNNKKIK
ncbi:MAG: hypothetical protein ACFFC7_03090 [Candidatus Hermodarchaeota archaeon]